MQLQKKTQLNTAILSSMLKSDGMIANKKLGQRSLQILQNAFQIRKDFQKWTQFMKLKTVLAPVYLISCYWYTTKLYT